MLSFFFLLRDNTPHENEGATDYRVRCSTEELTRSHRARREDQRKRMQSARALGGGIGEARLARGPGGGVQRSRGPTGQKGDIYMRANDAGVYDQTGVSADIFEEGVCLGG